MIAHGLSGLEFDEEFLALPNPPRVPAPARMQDYFDHSLVNALVISVPSDWYDAADMNQYDIDLLAT